MYHIFFIRSCQWTFQLFPCFGEASLVVQLMKSLPAMQETWVRFLGQEDPLEKEMATHSNILGWRIPWTEGPGGLQPMGSQSIRHDWATKPPPLPRCWGYYATETLWHMYPLELDFCPSTCPGVELLDHMVILFLAFWGTTILFSIVAREGVRKGNPPTLFVKM